MSRNVTRAGSATLLLVPGNHEFYTSSFAAVWKNLREASKHYASFHIMDNDIVTIDRTRFVGTTLWFQFQEVPPFELGSLIRGTPFPSLPQPSETKSDKLILVMILGGRGCMMTTNSCHSYIDQHEMC